jgi:hypothetical protein
MPCLSGKTDEHRINQSHHTSHHLQPIRIVPIWGSFK